ncbi:MULTISPECIES: hypothetical protein [unclassified Nocardiopsis]|uniref:hypothetical protein n=1 Tax=unclassified Nocardiopsis TaxID=2649073 RepID=UPI00135C7661|nr:MULTISPECIES: hypothetical protein [unclassified Nocardiopsis]
MYDNDQSVTARMLERHRARRGHDFLPSDEQLVAIPGRYGQEDVPAERAVIHLHYIGPEAHWWIAELWHSKQEPGTWEAYGYVAVYPGDVPAWSHINLTELERVSLAVPVSLKAVSAPFHAWSNMRAYIERDLDWTPRPAHECVPGVTLPASTPDPECIDADPREGDRRR